MSRELQETEEQGVCLMIQNPSRMKTRIFFWALHQRLHICACVCVDILIAALNVLFCDANPGSA